MSRRSMRLQKRNKPNIKEDNADGLNLTEQVEKTILKDDCMNSIIDAYNSPKTNSVTPVIDDLNESSSDCGSDFDIEEFTFKFANKVLQDMNPKSKNDGPEDFIKLSKDSSIFEEETEELPTSIDPGELNFTSCISFPSTTSSGEAKLAKLVDSSLVDDMIRKYSVITPDFEAKPYSLTPSSVRATKKLRKKERLATSGKDWFHMKAPEMTEDVRRDLEVLQMRSLLDPKRFYKSNDRKTMPKYFQVGKIMDNAADFYSSRLPKKQRKATLAEELLADADFKKHQKKRMKEIIAKRRALGGNRSRLKKKKSSTGRKMR